MGKEIAFENGRISNFQGLVTLKLTLDRVILHTVMHHLSSSTYTPNFIEIKKLFVDCYLLPTSKSRDTKTRTKIKNMAPKSFKYCALISESVDTCQPHCKWGRR